MPPSINFQCAILIAQITEVTVTPLAYLTNNATRIRVKAVGDLMGTNEQAQVLRICDIQADSATGHQLQETVDEGVAGASPGGVANQGKQSYYRKLVVISKCKS